MEKTLFYIFMLVVTGTFTLSLFLYLSRYRNVLGVFSFMSLMVAATIWSWAYAMELHQPTLEGKILWLNIQQIGILLAPVFWLSLALEYTERKSWIQGERLLYWCIIPIIAISLVWTNDLHHLMRVDVRLLEANTVKYIAFNRTAVSWVFLSNSYATLFACIILLVNGLLKKAYYWRQLAILLVSLLLPTLANILQIIGYNPLHPFGLTSLFFTPAGILIVWGLYRYQLFTIWPIARDMVIETMNDGILVTNINMKIVDFNPKAKQIIAGGQVTGRSEIKWQPVSVVLENWPEWSAAYSRIEQERSETKLSFIHGTVHYLVRINPLLDSWGSIIGFLAIIQDISEQKSKEEELMRLATIDHLTGIPNRRYFTAVSEQLYAVGERYDYPLAVLLLDVDNFKEINDTYGHKMGDSVLEILATVCQGLLRRSDMVGRIGGEEFAFTLSQTGLREGKHFAHRLMEEVGKIDLDAGSGDKIRFTVSIGVAAKRSEDRGFEDMLLRADKAMYKAKQLRNTVRTEEE